VTQIDLQRGQRSGLVEAREILREVRGIAFTEFLKDDVVRHPLVARIVSAYEAHSVALAAREDASRAPRGGRTAAP
jgi:phosphate starvation-inducible PhoH-like protein